ncbi:hypothetical protein EA658_09990 [Pseudoxanthomonas winnipegensis]|uniref:Lipoprotein n=1 Tax=Pseudoxanthomonas winnipegensis TaxID=2480810 RepID=A0ABY1WCU6_9GAMM|nr:hypothetical protein [Pseudoxanthomonas winnipegensis]TAA12439.1 hypothetical protein EA659_03660 [Pseudoxanthomonas winnipegensis]TAA19196.1 hypothetical protein EA658_09990 [Pseudoxanthomonas winnipegensis]TAH70457.1 hypothetical protein EA657_17055 [Pseudoxanthomonas winnipegensis]
MKKHVIVLSCLGALAACATTPGNLEQPQFGESFEIDQGYQVTLKNLRTADGECSSPALMPLGQRIYDVQDYPDLREAKIVQGAEGIGRQIYQVITIKEHDGRSTVTVYQRGSHRGDYAALVKRWASGSTDCKP